MVARNQQLNGGEWVRLGLYDLTPGQNHRVVMSDAGTGVTVADAILVEPHEIETLVVAADGVKFVANDAEDMLSVHADHLGSPQKMTDASRAVVWDAAFTPFGEEDSIVGAGVNHWRFPGQYAEAETGLSYNWMRTYDQSLGRYLQSDPIGLEGGLNTYAYVDGNPVSYVDPTGQIRAGALLPRMARGAVRGGIPGALIGGGGEAAYQLYANGGRFDCLDWSRIGIAAALGAGIGAAEGAIFEGLAALMAEVRALMDARFAAAMAAKAARQGKQAAGGGKALGQNAGLGEGKSVWPPSAKEMDEFLGMTGTRIKDGPRTPGRNKVVWQPNSKTKITYEEHPYDVDAPAYHRGPHYHLDTPGMSHQRFVPGDPIPGY